MFLHFKNAIIIHYKKSLYDPIIIKKMNKTGSRFSCPYCKQNTLQLKDCLPNKPSGTTTYLNYKNAVEMI